MATWRTPVVSLMPDLTPGPLRSQGNGIVNMLGGVGSLIAFVAGGALLNAGGFPLPFLVAGILMIVALVVLVTKVHEPRQAFEPEVAKPKIRLTRSEWKSLILILVAIFFYFVGYNAIETYFTLFATHNLGVKDGTASIILGCYAVAFLAFAIPAGFIGAKIGRRTTMLIGLAGISVCFIPMIIGTNIVATIVCLVIGGLFWGCININSLPMVLKIGGDRMIGTFTGYYYLFSVAAAIVGPPAAGWFIDRAAESQILFIPTSDNYRVLFLYSALAFVIALVVLAFVHHGEEADSVDADAQPAVDPA
jgi:MFS family permease